MDPLRGPDALDGSFVHELPGPLPDVGEGGRRHLEDVATFLLEEVRVADPVEVRQDVLLPPDLRPLPEEVFRDLPRLELDRADRVRRHDPLEHLAVQLAEQGGAVLHEDEVRDPLEHDVVGEGRRERREVALRDRDLAGLEPLQDFPSVADVHHLVEDLVVGLLHDREVDDLMEPVEDPLGSKLLPTDRDLAALVVPEDHEGPRRAVPEALLEQLRVPDGSAQEVFESFARDELREALQLDPLRDRDHEIVVRHGDADVRAVGLRDREGVGAAEGVVHAPPEGEVEDHVPIALHVDVAFEQHLPVRG